MGRCTDVWLWCSRAIRTWTFSMSPSVHITRWGRVEGRFEGKILRLLFYFTRPRYLPALVHLCLCLEQPVEYRFRIEVHSGTRRSATRACRGWSRTLLGCPRMGIGGWGSSTTSHDRSVFAGARGIAGTRSCSARRYRLHIANSSRHFVIHS